MHKLKYKQLLTLPKGKNHDGKELYISNSSLGTGKWLFCCRIESKLREIKIFDAQQEVIIINP